MTQDTEITRVIFRKFKDGDIIAMFPDTHEGPGLVSSYMNIGQHGAADRGLVGKTKPAAPEEYTGLIKELEGAPYGYRLKVLKRWPAR